MNGWLILFVYLILMNGIGFATMGIDKRKAVKHEWRIPERTLFVIAAIGGSVGSFLGMKVFRHKTKHKSFTIGLPLLFLFHIIITVIVLYVIWS